MTYSHWHNMAVIDLSWSISVAEGPEPTPAAYTPPAYVAGANLGQVAQGCGIIAPFQRDGSGDWRNGCGQAIIRASVERILGIVSMSDYTRGELPWRPEFGSLVSHLRHSTANFATADLARYRAVEALRIWEPRIAVIDATVEFLDGTDPGVGGKALEIRVLYNIVAQTRGGGTVATNVSQTVLVEAA